MMEDLEEFRKDFVGPTFQIRKPARYNQTLYPPKPKPQLPVWLWPVLAFCLGLVIHRCGAARRTK